MNQPIYKPIADGVYQHAGSVICVSTPHNQLSVSEKKPRMKIWVGELPANWRLCELAPNGFPAGDAFAVPAADIERLLRASEWTLGNTLEGNLLLRRVQRWLDGHRAIVAASSESE